MDDIVTRLREWRRGVRGQAVTPTDALMEEAAEEIERLRVDLNEALLDAKRAEAVIGAAVEVLTIKSSVLSRFWEAKEAYDKANTE